MASNAYGATALSAVSAISDTYSMYSQGKIARIGYDLQERTLKNNQKIAEWNAEDAKERGRWAQSQQRKKTKALQGSQRAAMAASGVDLTQGSPLRILTDTDYMGAQDEYQIGVNAEQEAQAYRMQALNLGGEAAMAGLQRDSIKPGLSAATSLISGATRVADRWYSYNK